MTNEQPDPAAQPAGRAEFLQAYDHMMQAWPGPDEPVDLASTYGSTRVWVAGPAAGTSNGRAPLVLLHAYQATSAEWIALATALAGERRIYAVDVMGDAGRSVPGTTPIVTPGDMNDWLDTVLDGLELSAAEICGHSYGGWIALHYALARPARTDRVTLLDPTMCFAPLFPAYLLRALPVLTKPSAERRASLIRWESRKRTPDPEWMQLTGLAVAASAAGSTVPTRIPSAKTLQTLGPPALVITAGRTKVHSETRLLRNARKRLPDVNARSVAGATHYGLPMTHAEQVAAVIREPPATVPRA